MRNSTRKWIRAGLEVLIHGGCSAVTSAFTASMVAPAVFPMASPNQVKMALGGFLTNGAIRFFQWWSNNPLPPESDTAQPTPVVSLNPLAKVQLLNKTET